MNIDQYLSKLNVNKRSQNLEFLNELIAAHQKTISFNNMAVYFRPGEILNLELGHLFEKVILRGEGGYCFENNKVFYHLLKGLGFNVESKAARVINSRPGDFPRTHRMNVVIIDDQRYVVDVGFGRNTPVRAIPFEKNETTKFFRVIKKGKDYLLQFDGPEMQMDLYTFDNGNYEESDFEVGNYYTSTHPNSRFVKEVIATRIEGELIELISGKTYSKIEGVHRENIEIKNQEEFQFYLKKFGIDKIYDFNLIP